MQLILYELRYVIISKPKGLIIYRQKKLILVGKLLLLIIQNGKYNLTLILQITTIAHDEPMNGYLVLAIVMSILSVPFIWWFVIYSLFPNGLIDYLFWKYKNPKKSDTTAYNLLLENHFQYYQTLSQKNKKIFLYKLDYLHRKIDFEIDETINWKKDNEVIILAYFVKLILFYPRFNYFSLKEIVVLPTSFYLSYYGRQPLKGLTKKQGEIYFSWESVLDGIRIHDDGVNLLIHEAAHAFMISADHHRNNYRKLINNVNTFFSKTDHHLMQYRASKPNMLRKYALVNEDEFFACCVELFFEKHAVLKSEHPELFEDVRKILNFPKL